MIDLKHRLLLIRHGSTTANQRSEFIGRRDVDLSSKGIGEMVSLQHQLNRYRVDLMLSSSLRRASRSAEIMAKAWQKNPQLDDRLVEQDFGEWDGLTVEEAAETFPEDFQNWRAGGPDIPPTGGEALQDVLDRVVACYQDASDSIAEGGTLAIVGHGAALQALICFLLDMPLRNFWPFRLRAGSLTELFVYNQGAAINRLSWY